MTESPGEHIGALCKGRGLNRTSVRTRLSPDLARLLEVPDGLPDAHLRAWLRDSFQGAARALPPDLAETVLAALGVTSQSRLLEERLVEVGARQSRSLRTMRRRLDEAKERLSQALIERHETSASHVPVRGWTFDAFALTLDLADERRLVTERTIRATRPHLDTVVELVHMPLAHDLNPTLQVDSLVGGEFAGLERVTPTSWRLSIRLPRPLAVGERHSYRMAVVLPPHQSLSPGIEMVPMRACGQFTATLILGPTARVASVYLHDGVSPDDPDAPRIPVGVPHGATLISHTFPAPQVGLRYALGWEWAD